MTARSVGGAFFQTRVRTPWMTSSSISHGMPGAVIRRWASAIDIAGQGGLGAEAGSLIGSDLCRAECGRLSGRVNKHMEPLDANGAVPRLRAPLPVGAVRRV